MLKDFSKEKFDIIIQAGQSNSVGNGRGWVPDPYEPSDLVWYMNEDFTVSMAAEKVAGNYVHGTFGLTFAREYVKNGLLQKGRKLLILRCAENGTCFWDNRWKMTGDLYLRMMEMIQTALSLNTENRLIAILWHQGESDALNQVSYEVHYHNLMGLVRSICEKFQVPDIPFIAGDFVHHWKNDNIEICTPVINAIRAVCRDYEKGGFVETDGLKSNCQELYRSTHGVETDTIHFSREAVFELGKRYFQMYCKLVE